MSKYFDNVQNLQDLRTKFRELALKYHPDRNQDQDTTALMQEINTEYEKLFEYYLTHSNFSEGRQKWERKIDPELRKKVEDIINVAGIYIEVCGNWLWITGNTKPVKDVLKKERFKFSGKKCAWFWHADGYRKTTNKEYSLDEIRNMHGTTQVKPDEESKQQTINYIQ